jgi:3-phenylpropionate/cinnamic acid dioxygenase small subunit
MELTLRDEIENLFFSYAVGFDEQRLDDLAGCFTEDAEFFSEDWVRGRDAIRAALAERREQRARDGQLPRHVNTNIRIEPLGEGRVRTHSLWNLVVTTRDGSYIDRSGTYEDELVQRDGQWLIARRVIARDVFA